MANPALSHSAVRNHLLAALPPESLTRLLPGLRAVPLESRAILHDAAACECYGAVKRQSRRLLG